MKIKITYKQMDELQKYANNPRNNEAGVSYVANSIDRFGFLVPIVIDKNGVIIAGHTRFEAAKQLGWEEVPCVMANELNEEQVKAFRLADNKVSEFSTWNKDLLGIELAELFDFDMADFGFLDIEAPEPLDLDDERPEKVKTCTCPKCGFEFEI